MNSDYLYKYIHMMPMGASSFCVKFILFVNENIGGEHLFVLKAQNPIAELSQFDNVVYEWGNSNIDILYKYVNRGEIIILHSFPYDLYSCVFINKCLLNKIIWWVWGHDLYKVHRVRHEVFNIRSWIFYVIKRGINFIYSPLYQMLWDLVFRFKLSSLHSVVVCCQADANTVKRKLGNNMKVFQSSYTTGYFNEDFDNISDVEKDGCVWIMIGHSAFEFLQHKKYLDELAIYSKENIKIILPLSYGDKKYSERISAYARKIYGEKVVILSENLDFLSYVALIKKIDVAIFDYNHQSALGNLALLFLFRKKVYLSPKGVLYNTFMKDGISVYDCTTIGKISFKEFIKSSKPTLKGWEYANKAFDKQLLIKSYNDLFNYLDRK